MPINYFLYENNLGTRPDSYAARVLDTGLITQKDIIDEMLQRGTSATRPDILGVLALYEQVICYFLQQGYRIDTPLVSHFLAVKGNFKDKDDRFNQARHKLIAKTSPGPKLQEAVDKPLPTRKQANKQSAPYPQECLDHATRRTNERLTPGEPAQVTGRRLKINPDDPLQGLYLCHQPTGSEIKITRLLYNKPSELCFIVPKDLPPGRYQLEIRAQTRAKVPIRTGRLPYTLTVT
jgi:hypothetical protein